MLVCKKCGNCVEGKGFCSNCGERVEHQKVCSGCGNHVTGKNFCNTCGAAINAPQVQEAYRNAAGNASGKSVKKRLSTGSKIVIGAASCVILAAIIVVVIMFSGTTADRPFTVHELLEVAERYLLEGNYEQALVEFMRVIQVDPMEPRGYTGAAEAYIGLDSFDDAADVLRQGLNVLPDNPEILGMIVVVEEVRLRDISRIVTLNQTRFQNVLFDNQQIELPDWYNIYLSEFPYMFNYRGFDAGVLTLFDINNDGMPEIIHRGVLFGEFLGAGFGLYYIQNGQIVSERLPGIHGVGFKMNPETNEMEFYSFTNGGMLFGAVLPSVDKISLNEYGLVITPVFSHANAPGFDYLQEWNPVTMQMERAESGGYIVLFDLYSRPRFYWYTFENIADNSLYPRLLQELEGKVNGFIHIGNNITTLPLEQYDREVMAFINNLELVSFDYGKRWLDYPPSQQQVMDMLDAYLSEKTVSKRAQTIFETIADTTAEFEVYNINGINHFNIRDIAYALAGTENQFSVSADDSGVLTIKVGQHYIPSGRGMARSSQPTASRNIEWTVSADGEEWVVTSFFIDGNYYFRLFDIYRMLGIETGLLPPVQNPTTVFAGMDFALVFDVEFYRNNNLDVAELFGDDAIGILADFVNNGMSEGRIAHPNFNVHVYRENNVDLAEVFGDDLKAYFMHYINYGHHEGRIASE